MIFFYNIAVVIATDGDWLTKLISALEVLQAIMKNSKSIYYSNIKVIEVYNDIWLYSCFKRQANCRKSTF